MAGWRGSPAGAAIGAAAALASHRATFSTAAGWRAAHRAYLTGDASARSYETVQRCRIGAAHPDEFAAAGARAAGTRRQGLCRDRPYGALGGGIRGDRPPAARAGFAVPEIYAQDLEQGFLLIETSRLGRLSSRQTASRWPSATRPRPSCSPRCMAARGRAGGSRAGRDPCHPALRPRGDDDRGGPAARLVCAGDHRAPGDDSERAGFAEVWNAALDRLAGKRRRA